jgi:hypothetical protein
MMGKFRGDFGEKDLKEQGTGRTGMGGLDLAMVQSVLCEQFTGCLA